jgi:hypothetical protein
MYKLINQPLGGQSVLRIADNAYIPMDEANSDYQEYLKFLAEGGQPTPADSE